MVEHSVHTRSVICSSQIAATRPVGQAVKTPPFHGGNMGSIPVRVTKSSEHFGSMGQKPSDFKVFGIFYDRKFSNYSMDQWKRYRGSNRV